MKVIPKTGRGHLVRCLRFYCNPSMSNMLLISKFILYKIYTNVLGILNIKRNNSPLQILSWKPDENLLLFSGTSSKCKTENNTTT